MVDKQEQGAASKQNADDVKTIRLVTRDWDLKDQDIQDIDKRKNDLYMFDIKQVISVLENSMDINSILKVGKTELNKLTTKIDK